MASWVGTALTPSALVWMVVPAYQACLTLPCRFDLHTDIASCQLGPFASCQEAFAAVAFVDSSLALANHREAEIYLNRLVPHLHLVVVGFA